MMRRKILIIFGLIISFTISFQAQNNLSAKDIEAIKKVKETYRISWLKNDEKTILSLFADDATFIRTATRP